MEVYVLPEGSHVPLGELAALLKLGADVPAAELSAVEWADRETVIDELATFFPFPRYFVREWEAVPAALAEQVDKGKLVLLRGLSSPTALAHLALLLDYAAAALLARPAKIQGRIVFVLEGPQELVQGGVKGQEKTHPVTRLDVPPRASAEGAYRLQISGKRNHTYYVNVALKVLARRPWHHALELSGLGNAIPSIVSIAEILKRYRVAVFERIETSLVELADEGRRAQKAKMVVVLKKIASAPVIDPDDDSEQTI